MKMQEKSIFLGGSTAACRYAGQYLRQLGLTVTEAPTQDTGFVLLDVPSFRFGENVEAFLQPIPRDAVICGGRLDRPQLQEFQTVDFLQDEAYLCENAYITAECALDVALPYINRTLRGCSVLILGWGRIGKALGQVLKNLGADVTIAARNPAHRAMAHALGYGTADYGQLSDSLRHYRLLFNTVPKLVLDTQPCREDCVKIELASQDGMTGEDIIVARGLPGLHMPESAGELMAQTFLRLVYGG